MNVMQKPNPLDDFLTISYAYPMYGELIRIYLNEQGEQWRNTRNVISVRKVLQTAHTVSLQRSFLSVDFDGYAG